MDIKEIEFYKLLGDQDGREKVIAKIRAYVQYHGKSWLAEFKKDSPYTTAILDLIANNEQDAAFEKLKTLVDQKIEELIPGDTMPKFLERQVTKAGFNFMIEKNKPEIINFYSIVRAEIDRKQF